MCLLLSLVLLSPRVAIVVYWLGWPARWEAAFDSFLVPFLGFLLAPWTTITYLLVGLGGVSGLDFLWLAMAVLADLASWLGGGVYAGPRSDA
jgi:hypothetical protein